MLSAVDKTCTRQDDDGISQEIRLRNKQAIEETRWESESKLFHTCLRIAVVQVFYHSLSIVLVLWFDTYIFDWFVSNNTFSYLYISLPQHSSIHVHMYLLPFKKYNVFQNNIHVRIQRLIQGERKITADDKIHCFQSKMNIESKAFSYKSSFISYISYAT